MNIRTTIKTKAYRDNSPAMADLLAGFLALFCVWQSAEGVTFGKDAALDSWRWQGSLQYQERHVCGCILLSNEWVLTGAHCIDQP